MANPIGLQTAGEKRAQQLARLAKLLKVSAVYSTDYKRTRNTAAPTCEQLGQRLEIYRRTSPEWIRKLEEKHSGGVILVVGHSNTTGALAGAAAEREAIKIGHDDYDNIFIVQVDDFGRSLVQLKFGD